MKRGDIVLIAKRDGTFHQGRLVRMAFFGPLDGEPYWEVSFADTYDYYAEYQILLKG